MKIEPLELPEILKITQHKFTDSRGFFEEIFNESTFYSQTGINFKVVQSNISVSNRGVIRGIHFNNSPEGQAKFVTCVQGSIIDIVVDIRPHSPNYKKYISVQLDAENITSIFIPKHFGHAFLAMESNTKVNYLVSTSYNLEFEKEINPFDYELNINWHEYGITSNEFTLSNKDKNAKDLLFHEKNGNLQFTK